MTEAHFTFALTLQNATEVPAEVVSDFLRDSPKAIQLFRDRDAMADWIVSRIKIGRYVHPLVFMNHFASAGQYTDKDCIYILSKIFSHSSLSTNIQFLITSSKPACTFLTSSAGIPLIVKYYYIHRWLFEVYSKNRYLSAQNIVTYKAIVEVITKYCVPRHKCLELLKEILSRTTHEATKEPKSADYCPGMYDSLWKDVITYYIGRCIDTREELESACKKLERSTVYTVLENEICSAKERWVPPSSSPSPYQG